MRQIFILLAFIISVNCVDSQIPVGVKFDVNGMPFNGYFDPMLYAPVKKISKVHNSDSYEEGYYYNQSGEKIKGLIKFDNDQIFFKKKDKDTREKIKPEEIRHFVIGVDSFFVVDKFYFKNRIKEKPEFVKYITQFNGYTFAKHYQIASGFAKNYALKTPIIETFIVKHQDSLVWDNFPDNSSFKEKALKYFSYIPYLKDKISSGAYESEDMLSVIKMADYLDKYNKETPLFYDKYWQEVRSKEKVKYKAVISNKEDTTWTFDYYQNNVKLYQAHYSSFYPNKNSGDFIAYYPNGQTRKIISFLDNKPQKVKTFSTNGLEETTYELIENKDGSSSNYDIDIKYEVVNDANGKNVLTSNKKATLTVKDTVSGYVYSLTYNANKLASVYRLLDKDTVFQITKTEYDFNLKSLQKKFDSFMSGKSYVQALNENAQGIILACFVLDKKGYVIQSTVLNQIHPELNHLVKDFINNKLMEGAEFRHKFKPFKIGKEKQYCEVVIPFEFSVNRFYRERANYNNWYFHNQMMQYQMMNSYKPPIPQSMPRGF